MGQWRGLGAARNVLLRGLAQEQWEGVAGLVGLPSPYSQVAEVVNTGLCSRGGDYRVSVF